MIVEHVGLPGAGKSYLHDKLLQQLRSGSRFAAVCDDLIDAQSRFHARSVKSFAAARFSVKQPRKVIEIMSFVQRSQQRSRLEQLTKSVNLFAELSHASRYDVAKLVMSEQGLLQAIWSLALRARRPPSEELLVAVRDWLPSVLVLVEAADPEQNVQRLRLRTDGRSRFDDLSGAQLLAELERGRILLHEILDHWSKLMPDGACYRIVNDTELQSEQLTDWIVEQYKSQVSTQRSNA